MLPHTAARRFSTQEIIDNVSRQRGAQRTESSKHAANASAALDVAAAAAGATSAASGPAAAESNLAFNARADVRQVLALHSVLHKFWDKYRAVLSDMWLKLPQNLRRNFWETVHPMAPESIQCPFFINDSGQREAVHGITIICPEICTASIIQGSNLLSLMEASASQDFGKVVTASLAHVRCVSHLLKKGSAEQGLHYRIGCNEFGQKVFLRPGESSSDVVGHVDFDNMMMRLSDLLMTLVLTAEEFRKEFLGKSGPSKLIATIFGCAHCGSFEQEDGRPLRDEHCGHCKLAYYCCADHKALGEPKHLTICASYRRSVSDRKVAPHATPNCADQVAPATAPPSLPPRDVQPVCYTTAAVLNRPHTTADGLEGWNTFTCAGGSVYQGEVRQGLKHGKGRMSHSNGDVYEGEWREGAMCGRGRYVHGNGTVFEGVFKDNKKCGPGICM